MPGSPPATLCINERRYPRPLRLPQKSEVSHSPPISLPALQLPRITTADRLCDRERFSQHQRQRGLSIPTTVPPHPTSHFNRRATGHNPRHHLRHRTLTSRNAAAPSTRCHHMITQMRKRTATSRSPFHQLRGNAAARIHGLVKWAERTTSAENGNPGSDLKDHGLSIAVGLRKWFL